MVEPMQIYQDLSCVYVAKNLAPLLKRPNDETLKQKISPKILYILNYVDTGRAETMVYLSKTGILKASPEVFQGYLKQGIEHGIAYLNILYGAKETFRDIGEDILGRIYEWLNEQINLRMNNGGEIKLLEKIFVMKKGDFIRLREPAAVQIRRIENLSKKMEDLMKEFDGFDDLEGKDPELP